MQTLRHIASTVGILLLCCLGAAMLATSASAAEPIQLRARLLSDIRSTDPGVNRDGTTDSVVMHIVEGLVALAEDTSIVPMLAASYDIAKDGVTYTFRLRRGIHFHNGALLTAGDVAWALKRYFDPATKWRCLPEVDAEDVGQSDEVEQHIGEFLCGPRVQWFIGSECYRAPIAAARELFIVAPLVQMDLGRHLLAPGRTNLASGSVDSTWS